MTAGHKGNLVRSANSFSGVEIWLDHAGGGGILLGVATPISAWSAVVPWTKRALHSLCCILASLPIPDRDSALDRVLGLYDREVRPESTDDLLDVSNTVALLWRLEQAGVDVGDRWQEWATARKDMSDHLLGLR